jgi:hypothetical protein
MTKPYSHEIRTFYWAKPIPTREFDWLAAMDNYEPGQPIGYGPTKKAAIADLIKQLKDI